jgi:hypothetical protein
MDVIGWKVKDGTGFNQILTVNVLGGVSILPVWSLLF